MDNVTHLPNRFSTPNTGVGHPAPLEKPSAAVALPSASRHGVATPAFLSTLLAALRDRDERRLSGLVRKVGYAAYPSLARSLETGAFGHSPDVFEKEVTQAIYALRHPETAKQSKLGRNALKLGLNLDFAVRTAFSEKGV